MRNLGGGFIEMDGPARPRAPRSSFDGDVLGAFVILWLFNLAIAVTVGAFFTMIAFGMLHSVFPVIPAIGFFWDSVTVSIAIWLLGLRASAKVS